MKQPTPNELRRRVLVSLGGLAGASLAGAISGCVDTSRREAILGHIPLAPAPGELPDTSLSGPRPERVLIVGAGITGIAAARALQQAGVPVQVLEGRDRIGGRIHTVSVGGVAVDAGAAWIHDPVGNPLSQLAAAAGLRVVDLTMERIVRASALIYPQTRQVRSRPWTKWRLQLHALRIQDALSRAGQSASASVAASLDALVNAESMSVSDRSAVRRLLDTLNATLWASTLEELGLANLQAETLYGGGDEVIVGGYGTLVARLAASLPIRKGAEVREIHAGTADATVVMADGSVEKGSHVIVTVPLGVLQSGAIRFEPPLGHAHGAAIASCNPGRFEKVVLRYEQRWWSEWGLGALLLEPADPDLPLWMDFSSVTGAPTLVGLCGGSKADALLDGGGGGRAASSAHDLLARLFAHRIPPPVDTYVTAWREESFTRGAYASLRPRAPRQTPLDLATPHAQRILFAGEHTSLDRGGTVDGALRSGVREACRLTGVPLLQV